MKKLFTILLILLISSICMTACDENPYTGKYQSSNNTTLILDANNSCTAINNSYKEAFYTNGKYVIQNNNIIITFDNNEPNYYGVSTLKGNFKGSEIKIDNYLDKKDFIYLKQ